MDRREAFEIAGRRIPPRRRATVALPMTALADLTPVTLSLHVVHGGRPGPVMFVSAAVHGDEIIGVDIVRRLLRAPQLNNIAGTLLAVPIVNTFGFLNQSRYLPDRRDLNRSFPGSAGGSLAARLAFLFRTEIMARCSHGIDLHSAAIHRTNLPQIRVSPGKPAAMALAQAFGAPVILTSKTRDGSLREMAGQMGVETLLYEAGEGLRIDEGAARLGVAGILRVMAALGMIPSGSLPRARAHSALCGRSEWLRAPAAGLVAMEAGIGNRVLAGQVLGTISDPFGETEVEIVAPRDGIVIGALTLPVANEGDAVLHVAELPKDVPEVDAEAGHMADEDEII